jgi:hypothetical protein
VGNGREVVYRFRLQARRFGDFEVIATGSQWDPALYLRAGACDGGRELACNDDASAGGGWLNPGVYGLGLPAGTDIYVFVDAFAANAGGVFELHAQLYDEQPPPRCQSDGDCPDGQVCLEGQCLAQGIPCGPNGQCPAGQFCGVAGFCESGCASNDDCPPPSTCDRGQCRMPQACGRDLDCPASYVCEGGSCSFTDACSRSSDCGVANAACVGSRCVAPIACRSVQDCSGYMLPLQCVQGFCQVPDGCRSDDECRNACVWGLCSPLVGPECVYDTACPDGRLCEDQRCR